jgi:hypothetical protein
MSVWSSITTSAAAQILGDQTADPTIADEDDMVFAKALLFFFGLDRGHLFNLAASAPAAHKVKEQRIGEDRQDGTRKDQVSTFRRQDAEAGSETRKNEREFTDLSQAHRNRQRRLRRMAERANDQEGRDRLAQYDDHDRREQLDRLLHDGGRVEEHAHGHEEEHCEGVAQRQRLLGGAAAERCLAQDHPGEKCAQRKGDIEDERCSERDAERNREHRQAEELP